jgi:hypothetical protein
MTSLPTPPIYIPSPPVDPVWSWSPPPSDTMRLLSFQKFFGAGGQVPTRRWSPYLYDDPALTWAPAFQNGPVRVTLTQTKFFGQPGQAVTRRWSQFYTYDDPAVWTGTPIRSDIVKVGKVFRYWWRFNYDDASPWAPQLENMNSATIPPLSRLGVVKPRQQTFTYDDPAIWTFIHQRNNSPSVVIPAAVAPFYAPNAPDIQGWRWAPYNNIVVVPKVSKPIAAATQWNYAYDNHGSWQWTPPNIAVNQLALYKTSGMSVPDLDDPPMWSWAPPRKPPLQPVPSPFIPLQWRYGLDDASTWQWTMPRAQPLAALEFKPFSKQWRYDLIDPPDWSWTVPSAQAATITALSLRPFSKQWTYNLDDAAVWYTQTQVVSQALYVPVILPPVKFFPSIYIPNPPDQPGWSGGLRPVPITITAVAPHPFTPLQWTFGLDDSAVWTGQSHNSFFTQKFPVSFVASMWNLNIPQDTPQSFYPQPAYALTLPTPVGTTLIQRTLTGVGL